MRTNKFKIIAGAFLALVMAGGMVMAEQEGVTFFNEADEAKAINIQYKGTGTATVSNNATSITITDDGNVNTITLTETLTAEGAVQSIMAVTNSSLVRNFDASLFNSISTDTLSNNLVVATVFTDISDGKREAILAVDTSASKTFDVARVPSGLANGIVGGSPIVITGVTGNAGGTGDVTLSIYVNSDMKFTNVKISPYYDSVDGTIFNTNANVNLSGMLLNDIYVGKADHVLVRATRATTATTGGIGLTFTQK